MDGCGLKKLFQSFRAGVHFPVAGRLELIIHIVSFGCFLT
jgi:hypothetical protein